MKLSRRTILAGAGVAAPAILHWHRADAAEFTLKLAHNLAPMHPVHLRALQASQKIAEESQGRLVMQPYPANQLGGDAQVVAQVRSGALEMLLVGDNVLGQTAPAASVASLPLTFDGYKETWAAMDGELGRYIHAQLEKIGLHAMDKGWDVGFRHVVTANRAVHTPDDMKGLKLRVPMAPIQVSFFKALGCSPTPIDTSGLYTALQTHLVDGAEQPLATIEYSKFYEVTKYVSLTAHQPTTFELVVNRVVFQRLPKNLQDILSHNLDDMALLERADILEDETALKGKLASQDMVFMTPEREAFRAVIKRSGLYATWRDAYGAEAFALLEKSVGKLV